MGKNKKKRKRPKEEAELTDEQKRSKRKKKEDKKKKAEKRRLFAEFAKLKSFKLKTELQKQEEQLEEQAERTEQVNDLLMPTGAGFLELEGMEKGHQISQENLNSLVDKATRKKLVAYELPEFGPYSFDYTNCGSYLTLAGRKGHCVVRKWRQNKRLGEVHLMEKIKDVKFLHNHSLLATAQHDYACIYDNQGTEVHCLRGHKNPTVLDYLPHHFLLASTGVRGRLMYHDTATGEVVGTFRTKYGPCDAMRQNPQTAVMNLGHSNGRVTMWIPSCSEAVVKMQAHKSKINDLAIDRSGRYLVTAGVDGKAKIWDVRTYKMLHQYWSFSPVTSLDISDRGVIALGSGAKVKFWKDGLRVKQKEPYLEHTLERCRVEKIRFCPYEDILGVGHSNGFTSVLVPGSGEPNFDSLVADPFASKRARREAVVQKVLDKLPPETIQFDTNYIGTVHEPTKEEKEEDEKAQMKVKKLKKRKKSRGRQKYHKKQARLQFHLRTEQSLKRKAGTEKKQQQTKDWRSHLEENFEGRKKSALSRFTKKKR